MSKKHSLVHRYGINTAGRDFVIGDIHGAFDLVVKAMRQARFDPLRDRLFSVGDLIDRGHGSHRVLGFLSQAYVHAVRGNHDHNFSELSIDEIRTLGRVNWNGLAWVCDRSDDELLAIQKKLCALPVAIEIETARGLVGLVHAEVPLGMDWSTFTASLSAGDSVVIESALEGRSRIQGRDQSGVLGVGRVFVGHTIQWEGLRRLGNVYAIDTGAVFFELGKEAGFMTMADLLCRTQALCAPQEGRPAVALYEASPADMQQPFGKYASPGRP
jgi:serine/threonine protein phosphatase 1